MPVSKGLIAQYAEKYKFKVTFYDNWSDNDDTSDQEFIAVLGKNE